MKFENIKTFLLSENPYKDYRELIQIDDEKKTIKFYSQHKKIGFPFSMWTTNLPKCGYQSANDFYNKVSRRKNNLGRVKIKEIETSAQMASEIAGYVNLAKYRQEHNSSYDDVIEYLKAYGLSEGEILKRIEYFIKYDTERHVVKITYANGDTMITPINGNIEKIKNFYFGNIFNIGVVEDNFQKVVKVDFLS